MERIIITGANGAGKSHLAAQLHNVRPDVPVISFDAIKLTTGWVQRSRVDINADLELAISGDRWILDGGPSVLPHALPRADAVVWLDPPTALRAWRLFVRPIKGLGQTRAELPSGNPDHLIQQYRFAWRSLRRDASFRTSIAATLDGAHIPILNCYTRVDTDSAVSLWARAAPD